jgi:hypothetical protein
MAKEKLGNDRVIFNKTMVQHLSGKDFSARKVKQIFMKPQLENYNSWIKDRIEF